MDREEIARLMSKFACVKLKTGNTRTCPARLSFPNCFHKSRSDDGEFAEKYGATLLFPKGANLDLLHADVQSTAVAKFGAKVSMQTLRLPFRDQGVKDKAGYVPGALFFRANSDVRPGILGPNGRPLTDEKELYAGCWVIATVNAFAYDKKGKGVAFGLQNIAKIADDEPFGGVAPPAEDEFADILDGASDASSMFEQSSGDAADAYDFG